MNATRIVTVWYDECDDEGTPWIVDTDSVDGGESETIRCFRSKERAVEFAKTAAAKRGCELRIA